MHSARDRAEERGLVFDERAWLTAQPSMRTVTRDQVGEVHHLATCVRFHGGLGSWTKAYSVVAVVVLKSRAMRDYVVV